MQRFDANRWQEIKSIIRTKLVVELDFLRRRSGAAPTRLDLEHSYLTILEEENIILPRVERNRLLAQFSAELLLTDA